MDTAINSTTKDVVNAWALELKDPSYQFPYNELWYADPNNIESYDKTKIQDITKVEVRFRKASYDVINYKGTKYDMPPSFFILNKEELGINTIPESKEHKLAKNWIYNCAKNNSISFIFSTASRPFDYNNKLTLKELDIAYDKIYIEVPVKTGRRRQRADIIIPFNKFHDLIGAGIVIEIQFSKQTDEDKDNRTINWALKGYSICWIKFEDFKNIDEDFIQLENNDLVIEVYGKTIKDFSEKYQKDFRLQIQEYYRVSYDKIKEFNEIIAKLKQELDNYSADKIIETSDRINEIKNSLNAREANLINKISNVENNPLGEIFELYKIKLTEHEKELSNKFDSDWHKKMQELNYPFAIKECPMCHRGIMYHKTTKTGKECYGCSAYPTCKHTIWIN